MLNSTHSLRFFVMFFLSDLFSRVLFSFSPLCCPPLFLLLLLPFCPCSPPRKVLFSVEQSAQHSAWRGAGPGWTFPQSSGRKILPRNLRENLSFLVVLHSCHYVGHSRKNPRAHKNKIGTSTPPFQKTHDPPLKGGILWAGGFSSRKNQKMPGAHKIGAAMSGPRIAGGNFMDITLFLRVPFSALLLLPSALR